MPLVYIKPFAYSWPHLRQSPALPVLPGRGRLARTVNTTAARLLRETARHTTLKPRGWVRVARENGVRLPRRTVDALDGDLNLIASIRLRPYLLPPNYRWVGPIYAHLDHELPPQVPRVVSKARKRQRPVVYFAMGSSANRDIVLSVLRELSRLPVTVLAPVARYLRPDDHPGLGEHVHVFDLLPAHLLDDLIDASVIHGGEGTVQTAAPPANHSWASVYSSNSAGTSTSACVSATPWGSPPAKPTASPSVAPSKRSCTTPPYAPAHRTCAHMWPASTAPRPRPTTSTP